VHRQNPELIEEQSFLRKNDNITKKCFLKWTHHGKYTKRCVEMKMIAGFGMNGIFPAPSAGSSQQPKEVIKRQKTKDKKHQSQEFLLGILKNFCAGKKWSRINSHLCGD